MEVAVVDETSGFVDDYQGEDDPWHHLERNAMEVRGKTYIFVTACFGESVRFRDRPRAHTRVPAVAAFNPQGLQFFI